MHLMNINDEVEVQLTPMGMKRWKDHYASAAKLFEAKTLDRFFEGKTVDGWTTFQLHELMHIFGPDVFNGSNRLPFVNNAVRFSTESPQQSR